jgi:transcriptional regulator with XRE-family HTH domain
VAGLRTKSHIALVTVIRAIRNEKKLTQRQLAERCKQAQSFVSKIEAGRRGVYVQDLKILARGLGVSELQLFRRYLTWRDAT